MYKKIKEEENTSKLAGIPIRRGIKKDRRNGK